MEKYDIMLTYEIRNREIENLCLIKRELERRGYSVGMCMQYDTFFYTPKPMEAEVLVVPGYYCDRSKRYTAARLSKVKKVFNMRWEQVLNNKQDHAPNSLCSIKEWGYDAVHVAWGERPYQIMTDIYGVPNENVKLCGQTALDFLRGKLRNYYDSREVLMKRYNIPVDKKVNLFISSLSMVMMHSHILGYLEKQSFTSKIQNMVDLQKKTQSEILSWFERALEENPDSVIVYRPHPEERSSVLLKELEDRNDRFFVIPDESVKQWILACDKVYTWFSTAVAEAYAAGKGCSVLRPVEVPFDNDSVLYNGSKQIKTYEEFIASYNNYGYEMGVSEELLKAYYYVDEKKYSYELVCDAIEEVYKDDKYLLKTPLKNPYGNSIFNIERFKNFIKRRVANSVITNTIYKKGYFANTKFKELLDDVFYVKNKLKNNHVTDEEINAIIAKIDKALE